MPDNHNSNNKRIAKNTLVLYVRMLILMAISLYTSRVILDALGVEDFGVYNVVGGFVALFGVLSKSLSTAASRFLNFEMGTGNRERLRNIFSTTLIIQALLALIIVIVGEIVGLWFVNYKMVIPADRLDAANWVFQFSVLTFCINLLIVPYNAAIIAHEKMSVFAYVSIYDGIVRLLICYLIIISPYDRLVSYAFFMTLIPLSVMMIYVWYCKKKYYECRFRLIWDKILLKEIFGFASWNVIGASSAILRNQGGNILINLFCGPVANAARAVANQVLSAVRSFVDSFMTALKPQITQSYARGDRDYMMTLLFQGSRFSYYMLLVLCLPIMFSADYLLHIWLKNVPEHSVSFVQLTLIFSMIESISTPLITAQLATGKVRNYQILVGGLQVLNVPISYVFLRLGGPPESILYVAIFISVCCLFARLYMLNKYIHLRAGDFVVKVLVNAAIVSFMSVLIPLFLKIMIKNNFTFVSFVYLTIVCLLSSMLSILYIGCSRMERKFVYSKALSLKGYIFK